MGFALIVVWFCLLLEICCLFFDCVVFRLLLGLICGLFDLVILFDLTGGLVFVDLFVCL